MQILPAIDIKGGKCVRLSQGEFARVETYSEDPVAYAMKWQKAGATRLHVVDLDGARMGSPQNLDVVRNIVRRTGLPVQYGGGVRNAEIVERLLRQGVERVVLGTAVAQSDALARDVIMQYGDKVIIGIDAKDGKVAVQGWQERLNETGVAFARRMESFGARRIVFTDIAKDGMLDGVNLGAVKEMLAAVSIPVIASGGVTSVEDVRLLASLGAPNLEAAIVGKALYAGKIDLSQAIAAANSGTGGPPVGA